MGENRFKQLRYKDSYCTHRIKTIDEMAEITGLRKSTISKIENDGVDSVNVATLRAYHDNLENVSYEYLMGDVPTKEKKYHKLGELFPFDDNFYHNLQQLLDLDKDNHFVEYMLNALLSNPEELFNFLITIFNALYDINLIKEDTELPKSAKTKQIKMQEYVFNQSTIEFLENSVMPLLKYGFNQENLRRENERTATEQILLETDLSEHTENPTGTNVNITLVDDKISE